MARAPAHKWTFRSRFRRRAFGWKSQPAVKRIKEAVSEIRGVARRDPLLGAEGAVLFLEKVSPAIEHVDGSSGAIGTAVNNAVAALAGIIADAPADEETCGRWLGRLWTACLADDIPYLESLGDHWGELCGSPEVASEWADQLMERSRMALSPQKRKAEVLADLVAHTPGQEGKWFAAAKSARLFDEAIDLANRTPCSPKTLTRAARDFREGNPAFAREAGMAALRWLVEGYGYEITSADVLSAYSHTMKAAEHSGVPDETRARIRELVSRETFGERFVTQVLGPYLELG